MSIMSSHLLILYWTFCPYEDASEVKQSVGYDGAVHVCVCVCVCVCARVRVCVQIYDYRDCRTFVGAALSYADPFWDCQPRNWSAIPTTEYGLPSAQIQAYSDRTTRFSCIGSNHACPAGDVQKKVQIVSDRTVYIRISVSGLASLVYCIF